MFYDFSFLWVWLVLTICLGCLVGALTFTSKPQAPWLQGRVLWSLIAFMIGLVVAWLDLFPRRLGFWLETALFFFAAYVLGCLLGSFLKARTGATKAALSAEPLASVSSSGFGEKAPPATAAFAEPVSEVIQKQAAAAGPDVPMPAEMGPVEGEEKHAGARPTGYVAARNNKADNLQRIKGIGPQNESRLHALGVWHFSQIANWTQENVLWVGSYLAFPGRIDREQWLQQARILAEGLETEFSERVEKGLVPNKHESN